MTGQHHDCHTQDDACHNGKAQRYDWLLWGSAVTVALLYLLHLSRIIPDTLPALAAMAHGSFELMNTMAWGMALGVVFVGLLGKLPRDYVTGLLGPGGSLKGLLRAAAAGVLLDLCSHGILMVGMRLYERGASLGQVMAFLIASPWNSFSLTLILWALIGLPWTLAFIGISLMIAIISGLCFEALTGSGRLPANSNSLPPSNMDMKAETLKLLRQVKLSPANIGNVLMDGLRGSRMVWRWVLFGVILAAGIRAFMDPETMAQWFGATASGLLATIAVATVLEVCSEGSVPLAADLLTRAKAPGNAFAFLMSGVSTDYTEIMALRDTTKSWKIALALPLITVPQVVAIGWLINLA